MTDVQDPQQQHTQSQRVLSIALLLTGLAIVLLAIFADTIRLGTGRGFGYYQLIVLIAGIIIMIAGLLVYFGGRHGPPPRDEYEPEP